MKFSIPKCPECGELATGTLEEIRALATIEFDEDGTAEYAGDIEVYWDTQETIKDAEGNVELRCIFGHAWESKMED